MRVRTEPRTLRTEPCTVASRAEGLGGTVSTQHASNVKFCELTYHCYEPYSTTFETTKQQLCVKIETLQDTRYALNIIPTRRPLNSAEKKRQDDGDLFLGFLKNCGSQVFIPQTGKRSEVPPSLTKLISNLGIVPLDNIAVLVRSVRGSLRITHIQPELFAGVIDPNGNVELVNGQTAKCSPMHQLPIGTRVCTVLSFENENVPFVLICEPLEFSHPHMPSNSFFPTAEEIQRITANLAPLSDGTYPDATSYLQAHAKVFRASFFVDCMKELEAMKNRIGIESATTKGGEKDKQKDSSIFRNVRYIYSGESENSNSTVIHYVSATSGRASHLSSRSLKFRNTVLLFRESPFMKEIAWGQIADDKKRTSGEIGITFCDQLSNCIFEVWAVEGQKFGMYDTHQQSFVNETTVAALQAQAKCLGSTPGNLLTSFATKSFTKSSPVCYSSYFNIHQSIPPCSDPQKKCDEGQQETLEQCFQNSCALIQGPPGTGKTFIGTVICDIAVQMLNFCSNSKGKRRQVLVVTHKNRSLDDFLDHLLDMGIDPQSIIRLGKRGSEHLEHLWLESKRQDSPKPKTNFPPSVRRLAKQKVVDLDRIVNKASLNMLELWKRACPPNILADITQPIESFLASLRKRSSSVNADAPEMNADLKPDEVSKALKLWIAGHDLETAALCLTTPETPEEELNCALNIIIPGDMSTNSKEDESDEQRITNIVVRVRDIVKKEETLFAVSVRSGGDMPCKQVREALAVHLGVEAERIHLFGKDAKGKKEGLLTANSPVISSPVTAFVDDQNRETSPHRTLVILSGQQFAFMVFTNSKADFDSTIRHTLDSLVDRSSLGNDDDDDDDDYILCPRGEADVVSVVLPSLAHVVRFKEIKHSSFVKLPVPDDETDDAREAEIPPQFEKANEQFLSTTRYVLQKKKKVNSATSSKVPDTVAPDVDLVLEKISSQSLWTLTRGERKLLVQHFTTASHDRAHYSAAYAKQLSNSLEFHNSTARSTADISILEKCDVIAVTVSGCVMYRESLAQLLPEVIIFEEAAEILESQALACIFPSAKHVVMIGDHFQLQPSVSSYEMKKTFNLRKSLFERIAPPNSDTYLSKLEVQRRMHPSLSALVRKFYEEGDGSGTFRIKDDPSVIDRGLVVPGLSQGEAGGSSSVRALFWSHKYAEDAAEEGLSKVNRREVMMCAAIVRFLLDEAVEGNRITVLSYYKGQCTAIRNELTLAQKAGVEIRTVDSYQGSENDIIILSLVRHLRKTEHMEQRNRMIVGVTRAREAMFIVGSESMMRKFPHWEHVLSHQQVRCILSPELPATPKREST